MKGSVNQRLIVLSASAAVPWLRAIARRSSHRLRGGISLAVSHSASESTLRGKRAPSCWPIIPPMERPTKCAEAMPSASSRPAASSASVAIV